jgi:hypothetical protein
MNQPVLKEILLLEYEKLKDEQRARIGIRENLFYIALVVVGAVFSALLNLPGLDIGYLAVTPILFVIANSYYYNDEFISRMNSYVRESLAPRLAASAGLKAEELFQWEGYIRRTHRVRRRLYQFVANLGRVGRRPGLLRVAQSNAEHRRTAQRPRLRAGHGAPADPGDPIRGPVHRAAGLILLATRGDGGIQMAASSAPVSPKKSREFAFLQARWHPTKDYFKSLLSTR